MNLRYLPAALLLGAGILVTDAAAQYGDTGLRQDSHFMGRMRGLNPKQAEFQDAMRKLWEDHVTWTRLFIVSAVADLPDKEATLNRLLRNQTDIGNAIKPYYGNAAGNKLTSLLREHIVIAGDVVTAAKRKNNNAVTRATKRWEANADEISKFLSDANPSNWSYNEMRRHMRDHLRLTTDEAVAQINRNWSASINAFDKVHTQILAMSDMLSVGIMSQHASKFGGDMVDTNTDYAGSVIDMRFDDYSFSPSVIRVRPGQEVRIRVRNDSGHDHNITFRAGNNTYSLQRALRPGQSGEIRFIAPMERGTYGFWCPIGDHAERGMRGTLIVD